MTCAVKITQIFFLLAVKAENWVSLGLKFNNQRLYVPKLFITMCHCFHGSLLLGFPAAIVVLLEQFVYNTLAHFYSMLPLQQFRNFMALDRSRPPFHPSDRQLYALSVHSEIARQYPDDAHRSAFARCLICGLLHRIWAHREVALTLLFAHQLVVITLGEI